MRGFTLIELLVVVLIIGILSAVALPQYQKAVEKSRAAQPLSVLKSVAQAYQVYYMSNGTRTTKFDELDLEIPWTGTKQWISANGVRDTRSNEEWSLQIYDDSQNMAAIMMGRLTGPYKGAGWAYWTKHDSLDPNILYCCERSGSGIVFSKAAGDYCQKLFSAREIWSNATVRVYAL